jgi:hypothetical protein
LRLIASSYVKGAAKSASDCHSRRFRPVSRKSALRPKADLIADMPEVGLSAMYGRRPRCKGKIGHFSEAFGCSHVFGLLMRPLWPLALM